MVCGDDVRSDSVNSDGVSVMVCGGVSGDGVRSDDMSSDGER